MLITGLLLAIQATKMEELYNVVKMANIPDLFILDEKKVCVRVVLGRLWYQKSWRRILWGGPFLIVFLAHEYLSNI